MKAYNRLFIIALIGLFLASCGASIESEMADFERNKKRLNDYQVKYPILKDVLAKDLSRAEEALTEAQEIADEDQKIDAIQQANGLISEKDRSGEMFEIKFRSIYPIHKVIKFENVVKTLDSKRDDIERIEDSYFSEKTTYLLDKSKEYKTEFKKIEKASYSSADELLDVMEEYVKEVNAINNQLADYYKDYNDAKRLARDKEKAQRDSIKNASSVQTSTPSSETKEIASIKCSKCGKVNSGDVAKCVSCGAPLKK